MRAGEGGDEDKKEEEEEEEEVCSLHLSLHFARMFLCYIIIPLSLQCFMQMEFDLFD
jgi:hypothetical protein